MLSANSTKASDDPSGEVLLPADLDRIIHFTELNSSDWWVSALDRIILAVLWSHKEPADLATITADVGSTLGSQVMGARVATSLGKMVASGQVFELSPDRFKISEETAKSLGDAQQGV